MRRVTLRCGVNAAERCRSVQASRLCTVRQARIQLAIVLSLAVLYNAPKFGEARVQLDVDPADNSTWLMPVHTALGPCTRYTAPCTARAHGARREPAVQRRLRQRLLHGVPARAAAGRARRTQRPTDPRGEGARTPAARDEAQEQSPGAGQQRDDRADRRRPRVHHLSDACPRDASRRPPPVPLVLGYTCSV